MIKIKLHNALEIILRFTVGIVILIAAFVELFLQGFYCISVWNFSNILHH